MQKGKVKWFNNTKGYGFIRPDAGGEDLFVHYSYIDMSGYKTLKAGQGVSFETQQAPKGQHAVNVMLHEPEVKEDTISEMDASNEQAQETTTTEDLSAQELKRVPILTDVIAESSS